MRARAGGRGWLGAAGVGFALAVAACSGPPGAVADLSAGVSATIAATATTTTIPPTTAMPTTTTTVAPTTTLPPITTLPPATAAAPPANVAPAAPEGWGPGDQGVGVLELEQRLDALGYYVGTLDNLYDDDTAQAVLAFQKVSGLERSGRATFEVVEGAIGAAPPAPLVPGGGFLRVEIDLDRQVLFLYENDQLALILNAATGNNERFCSQGWCRNAVTPTGAYTIYEQRSGWETAPLGRLYNSQYFNGGIAIHGSPSVPAYPASHGCVRISLTAAEWFPDRVRLGTPVYVVAAGEPLPTPVGLTP